MEVLVDVLLLPIPVVEEVEDEVLPGEVLPAVPVVVETCPEVGGFVVIPVVVGVPVVEVVVVVVKEVVCSGGGVPGGTYSNIAVTVLFIKKPLRLRKRDLT